MFQLPFSSSDGVRLKPCAGLALGSSSGPGHVVICGKPWLAPAAASLLLLLGVGTLFLLSAEQKDARPCVRAFRLTECRRVYIVDGGK